MTIPRLLRPLHRSGLNDSTIRLLGRIGCEVTIARGAGCCGALAHHMGRSGGSRQAIRQNIAAWTSEHRRNRLDAIIVNASGCGTMVKDYGNLMAGEPEASAAAEVAGLAKDVSEFIAELGLPDCRAPKLRVAYHAACSLQHGQQIRELPARLLADAGFEVVEPIEAHICCGSAGTYNLLQPELAGQLRHRKIAALEATGADVIATGNIGCQMQISSASIPVVHTVELLDWASGGPRPARLANPDRGNIAR